MNSLPAGIYLFLSGLVGLGLMKALGITWPPKKKWKKRNIGTAISKEDKDRFEISVNITSN